MMMVSKSLALARAVAKKWQPSFEVGKTLCHWSALIGTVYLASINSVYPRIHGWFFRRNSESSTVQRYSYSFLWHIQGLSCLEDNLRQQLRRSRSDVHPRCLLKGMKKEMCPSACSEAQFKTMTEKLLAERHGWQCYFFFRGQTQEFAKRWVRLTSLTIHPVVFLLGNLILQEGSWYSEKNPAPSWYRFIIMMQCLLYLSIGFHFKNQWCFNFFPTSLGGFTNHHLLDDPPLTKDLKACQDGESCGLVYSTPFHHVDAGCLEKTPVSHGKTCANQNNREGENMSKKSIWGLEVVEVGGFEVCIVTVPWKDVGKNVQSQNWESENIWNGSLSSTSQLSMCFKHFKALVVPMDKTHGDAY